MLQTDDPAEMKALVCKPVGTGGWGLVDQAMTNAFGDATADQRWIPVDVDRAKQELADDKTITRGYLTLSLLLRRRGERIRKTSRGISYGSNKTGFTAPVPAGSRVCLYALD